MNKINLWLDFFEENKLLMQCARICESLSKVENSENFVEDLITIQNYSKEVTEKLYNKGIIKRS
jgi:hypothetical protein